MTLNIQFTTDDLDLSLMTPSCIILPAYVWLAGSGCSGRDGGDGFSGSEACCGSGVRSLDRVCSTEIGAPCVVVDGESSEA